MHKLLRRKIKTYCLQVLHSFPRTEDFLRKKLRRHPYNIIRPEQKKEEIKKYTASAYHLYGLFQQCEKKHEDIS